MKLRILWLMGYLALAFSLSDCTFVSQQLSDKRMEEQLLKPGALDSPVATNFNEYHFRFLDKYRVVHAWPVTSACKYAGHGTQYQMGETSYGEVQSVLDIYEEGGTTRQRDASPGWNFNRFVRSIKVQRPVYDTVNGVRGIVRYEENEEGLQPICFEAWVGSSHAVTIFLYQRTVGQWQDALAKWSKGAYLGKDATQGNDTVMGNRWHVYRLPLKPREMNRAAGAYELRILPIGDTGYTFAMEFGATVESLENPQAHAAFQAMFKRLIESVKIEPLTPTIEAEMAQLKAKAFEIVRQNCLRMKNPPGYCKRYLDPK
jgi:hypothetical protein